jgi:hypothetical protein
VDKQAVVVAIAAVAVRKTVEEEEKRRVHQRSQRTLALIMLIHL